MPCGGIWPATPDVIRFYDDHPEHHDCLYCRKDVEKKDLMWCEEWDCYLHRACVVPFLETREGQVILKHGHEVILYWEVEESAKPEQ